MSTANPSRVHLRVGGAAVDLHRPAIAALCRFDHNGVLPPDNNPHSTIPGGLLRRGWARHNRGRIILTDDGHRIRAALVTYLRWNG